VDPMSLFDLKGKTAIVTGASSGLGIVFAETLVKAGASVVLAARRIHRVEAVAKRIVEQGGTAVAIACDVDRAPNVERLFREAEKRFPRIDIVVNNAGVIAEKGMVPEKVPPESFEQTVRTNLFGTWYGCREAAIRMLADGKGGSIINISSIGGLAGGRDWSPGYVASKAAVINLTKSLACSWSDRGVRVNAIAPGWFPSEMTDPYFRLPAFGKWVEEGTPMGRRGKPEELAGALLFLASDASQFVTGHTLVVDGGLSAMNGQHSFPDDLYEILDQAGDMGRHIRHGAEARTDD
jgi:NAD(P)-dependent dehydrogenase (short-subunit alcohol dehydrogenase family)